MNHGFMIPFSSMNLLQVYHFHKSRGVTSLVLTFAHKILIDLTPDFCSHKYCVMPFCFLDSAKGLPDNLLAKLVCLGDLNIRLFQYLVCQIIKSFV